MKKLLSIILLPPLLFLLFRCENENEQIEETIEKKIEIYCTYGDTTKQLISDNDSITIEMGDTLFLFVEVTGIEPGSVSIIGGGLEIEETGNDMEYVCVAKEAGLGGVAAYSRNTSSDLLINLLVNIPSFSYLLAAIEEPSFVINVEDESLETTIQTELENSYTPDFDGLFWFTCTAIDGGDLQLIANKSDTLPGTFASSNVIDMNDLTINYSNSTYNFILEKEPEECNTCYYLIQNLTEEFRTKYPSETINEITITTLVVIQRKYSR